MGEASPLLTAKSSCTFPAGRPAGRASGPPCGPTSPGKPPSVLAPECNPCRGCFSGVGWSRCICEQEGRHAGKSRPWDFFLFLNFRCRERGPCGRGADSHWSQRFCPFHIAVLVAKSCPGLCNPMDCSPPGSSVRGILQARVLEWVAISFSRGSSRTKD